MNFDICGGPRMNSHWMPKGHCTIPILATFLYLNFISKQMVKRKKHSASDPNPSDQVRWICKSHLLQLPQAIHMVIVLCSDQALQGVPCLMKQHRGKVEHGEILESGMLLREGDQLAQFPWDRGVHRQEFQC